MSRLIREAASGEVRMMNITFPFADARTWEVNPVISPWLLILGGIVAVVAAVYLYRAQQKIASRAIVGTLTVIRAILIVLVIALLLGPVLQWTHVRHSDGTLWVLLDDSLSMRQTDPQSTPQERLRWADALGYLPPDLHPERLDVAEARLVALRDEAEHLKSQANLASNDEPGMKQFQALSGSLKEWPAKLDAVADSLQKTAASSVANDLKKTSTDVTRAASQLDAIRPEEVSNIVPWQAIHDSLSSAIASLHPLGDKATNDFLRDHGSDPAVQQALAKVAQLSRSDLAYAALTGKSTRGLKSFADAIGAQDVKVVRFGDHTQLVSLDKRELDKTLKESLVPAGQNTDIAAGLRFVGEQLGADSSVLLVSDGRQNVGSNPEDPAQFLAARGARVFALTVGSRQTARDAAVDHIDAPDWVYAEDDVVVSPVLRLDGLKPGEDVTVDFRRGSELIKTEPVKADAPRKRLTFTDKPPSEGLYDYQVFIRPVPDEAVKENNQQTARVSVKKSKLHVLLVEDEPRWEYQFLRNYLMRDHRVQLQTVLVDPARIAGVELPEPVKASPNRDENEITAQELPATREEWSAFDIVVLGDVPPERLPLEQQRNISTALRDGGIKGLLVIAGPRNMPLRYAGMPLSDLLPIEMGGTRWTPQELQEHIKRGFSAAQAPEGLASVLSQFSQDPASNAQLWASLPTWYGHNEQTQARPGANVIWTIEDVHDPSQARKSPNQATPDEVEATRQHALLCTMSVGLGRVMYLASPDTWRLRYVQTPEPNARVEDLHRRFWGQVVRWAVGSDLPAGGKFVRFGTNRPSYVGGDPVVVTARVLKQDLTPLTGQSFKVYASPKGAPAGSHVAEATMNEAPAEGPGIYRATINLPPGSFMLSLHGGQVEQLLANDSSVDAKQKTLEIQVQPNATVEDQDVNADHEKMASIARAGGGIALDGAYFDVLADHLPQLSHSEPVVEQAGLFSNPDDPRTRKAHWVFFALFVLLITAEWVLRKRGGLV